MAGDLAALWEIVNRDWGIILEKCREKLPCDEMIMYLNDGSLVPSERPLIESLICDRMERHRRFFFYMLQAGLMDIPEADVKIIGATPAGGRIIQIGGYTRCPMGSGGKGEKANA